MDKIRDKLKVRLGDGAFDYVNSKITLSDYVDQILSIVEREQEDNTVETIGLVVGHIWQFARGTGHPLKWTISDTDKRAVLKHYGVHYQGDNCPTCEGKCTHKT